VILFFAPLLAVGLVFGLAHLRSAASGGPQVGGPHAPRRPVDTSGFQLVNRNIDRWDPNGSLTALGAAWDRAGPQQLAALDRALALDNITQAARVEILIFKAQVLSYQGEPARVLEVLREARALCEREPEVAREWLYTLIYYQGVASLRLGEDQNCVDCRGASACILPLDPAAVHQTPEGSQGAVRYFTEYLAAFAGDLEVRWLLNLAHMTLGRYPDGVDPRYLLPLERLESGEAGIGEFRDIGHLVGFERVNWAGGAIMDDFDNDGRLDVVLSSFNPGQAMAFYRNTGAGRFEDRTESAGLAGQLGGLYCVQADFDNDGHLDVFVPRGAWLDRPMPPSLLRNLGGGRFTDVTAKAGVRAPVNANTAAWADFDNDGDLDLFLCSEQQAPRLYSNKGDGTFEDAAPRLGLAEAARGFCKGIAWIDYDNDGYRDLFLNYLDGNARLFRNHQGKRFTDVSEALAIDGPRFGFSCWAFDYDNDGWEDLFATSYDRTVADVVRGLLGQPHRREKNRLFRNVGGRRFEDVTAEAGLDMVFSTMGSNFADFDNDGFLDMYLATGEPQLGSLMPNRMLRNLKGRRFADITGSSRTGHLQKGHSVACGDWDRDGNVDLFVELGGASHGDQYHNALFQNPGSSNRWVTLKLIGSRTNRSALGARIKVVTDDQAAPEVHRTVTSGSSFGANPLEQTIGLGRATRIVRVEVRWPTSGTTQVFRNVPLGRAFEIREFAHAPRPLDWRRLPAPAAPRVAAR